MDTEYKPYAEATIIEGENSESTGKGGKKFKCNETKLKIVPKIYNNNLYMLLNPSAFFKICLRPFFKEIHFLI